MKKQGHEFHALSEQDHAEMLTKLQPFTEKWKTETCKGLDPALVDRVLKFTRERSAYHSAQMNAGASSL